MSTCKVDERYRILINKKIRKQVNIEAGDIVILEPINDHSFKVAVIHLDEGTLEDDPAWKVLHTPVKAKEYISPKRLEEIMEEEVWRE